MNFIPLTEFLRRAGWRALMSASLTAVAALAAAQSTGHDIDTRWNRSVPAGPYTQVGTSYGGVDTDIPFCSIKGPGGSAMSIGIHHRSNQAYGTVFATTVGGAGRGFTLSCQSMIGPQNNEIIQTVAGNMQSGFIIDSYNAGTGFYTIHRQPGCRADALQHVSGGATTGWTITDQATKAQYNYYQATVTPGFFQLTSIVDTHGNTVSFLYDSYFRLYRINDASGVRNITIAYGSGAQTVQASQVTLNYPSGSQAWNLNYDVNNWLANVTLPPPITNGTRPILQFHYTSEGNIDDLWDLNGNHWHYRFQQVANLVNAVACTGVYAPYAPSTTSQYDSAGTYLSWANSADNTERYCYIDWPSGPDASPVYRRSQHTYYNNINSAWLGEPIKKIQDAPVAGDGNWNYWETYVWNTADGTLTSHSDRRGNTTSFTYDPSNRGLVYTRTDPETGQTGFLYYSDKMVTKIDPVLDRTTYIYNNITWDLVTTTVDPKTDPFDGTYNKPTGIALTTNNTFTAQGELASTWTGSDTSTTYSNFDAYGNCRTFTEPGGAVTTAIFDDLNNKLSTTKPSPQGTTTFTYDNWNRALRTVHPNGSYSEIGYDFDSNKTSGRDENGHTATMAYDARNRMTSTRQPVDTTPANDIVTSFSYDEADDKTSVTNGRGKTSTSVYDERHTLTKLTYPDLTTRQFHVDGNGNRDKSWNGKGQLTTFTYDKCNRLKTISYPDSTSITNTWRLDGVRSAMLDSTGTTTWNINSAKQLSQCFQPIPNKTVYYTYDSSGRRKTTQVDAQTWTINYDAVYRPFTVTQTVGAATPVTFAYNTDDSISTRTNGNGMKTVFTYDTWGRTTGLSHQNSSGVVQESVGYTFDDASNVSAHTHAISGGSSWSTAFLYDQANQQTSEVRTGGSTANFTNLYSYDKNGNRLTVTRNGSGTTYAVDDNDRFQTGDGFTFSNYDADGNPGTVLSSSGTKTLTFDAENRVKTIVSGVTNSFRYNGDSQRVEKVDSSGTTRFVYDGSAIIAETNSAGTTTAYYLPGVGFVSGTTQFYYRENGAGSNLTTVDNSGNVNSRTEYDGFGIEYNILTGTKSNFRFAGGHGYVTDLDSGMDMLGARYYLPALGRFLTQDPSGQTAGLNLYEYCSNNPLTVFDPTGHQGIFDGYSFGDYLRDVGGVFRGYANAVWATVKSPYTATQFVGTWAGNGWSGDYFKAAMSGTWENFRSGISGERGADGFGESFGDVLITVGSLGSGFAEGGAFSKVATVTRWDTPAALESGVVRAGSWVQRGRGGPINYIMSGAIERYPFASKVVFQVSKSSLTRARGLEGIVKYPLGQRIIVQTYHF